MTTLLIDRFADRYLRTGDRSNLPELEENRINISQLLNEEPDSISLDFHTVETKATTQTLKSWIEPLHLEANLNAAMETLELATKLLREIQQLQYAKIELHSIRQGLDEHRPDSEVEKHDKLVKALELEETLETHKLRYSQKVAELAEYSKAVKLGAKVLFNWDVSDSALGITPNAKGLNIVRQSLRQLQFRYKKLMRKEQESTFPVSIKYFNAGDAFPNRYLISNAFETKPDGKREVLKALKDRTIVIDMQKHSVISGLKFARLRQIGIQIVDKASCLGLPNYQTPTSYHTQRWSATLTDHGKSGAGGAVQGRGVALGDSAASPKLELNDIYFPNIAGSRSPNEISWSQDERLMNFDPIRRWQIQLDEKSHRDTGTDVIYDVIVYFRIAYQAE